MVERATCERCGRAFTVREELRERYPGWSPRLCPGCFRGTSQGAGSRGGSGAGSGGGRSRRGPVEHNLSLEEVLERYDAGPSSGVFTDGSAHPNPGPGGWGAVYVIDGDIVDQAHGGAADTTNNRMELTALLHGIELVPEGTPATVYTDSKLCRDTITKWASGWERRGWKRKTGPVENLDLVRPLFERFRERPELELEWIPAHSGYRWNEYADSLSTAYLRDRL